MLLWVVYGVLMGHGAEGGAEWIRGREGGRGLGRRVDRIDCIDRIDPMDGMDGMDEMDGMDGEAHGDMDQAMDGAMEGEMGEGMDDDDDEKSEAPSEKVFDITKCPRKL